MDTFERIERRWGFVLPKEYKMLAQMGALDDENENYLRLTYIKWYHPAKLEGQDLPEFWKPGITPFAVSPKGDHLSWVVDWQSESGIASAFCLRGSGTAKGFAPNFAGSVYRALIEEFTGSLLSDSVNGLKSVCQNHIEQVRAILPSVWMQTLRELLVRQPRVGEEGIGFLEDDEARGIIERDLAFSRFGEVFQYAR